MALRQLASLPRALLNKKIGEAISILRQNPEVRFLTKLLGDDNYIGVAKFNVQKGRLECDITVYREVPVESTCEHFMCISNSHCWFYNSWIHYNSVWFTLDAMDNLYLPFVHMNDEDARAVCIETNKPLFSLHLDID